MTRTSNDYFAILCVDAMDQNIASGRFYCGDLKHERTYVGIDQFLLTMDSLLDGGEASAAEHSGTVWQPGKVATFKLQILFRRNATWQGSVMWLETRHEENFRSVLELMSILNQALSLAQTQKMCPSSLKVTKQ